MFPTDHKKKRGWGERMFSGIGTSYMCGEYNIHVFVITALASCIVYQQSAFSKPGSQQLTKLPS